MKTHAVPRARLAGLAAIVAAITTMTACSSSGGGDTNSPANSSGSDTSSSSSSSATTPGTSSADSGGGSSSSAPAAGAFNPNLDDCDDPDAANKQITGTWKIGYSLPLSGPVAGVVTYATDGFDARIAAQNAAGGINGVKLQVIKKDDAFTPDRAKANVTQFLQQDKVDSLVTFGSGSTGAMADDQNAACVPLLYPSSSVAQYRNISQYPWTVQFLPSADKEAVYDVKLIQQKFPGGATVGIAENQTASGQGESDAFQKAAKGTNVKIAVVAPSTDPNAAATQIKAKNPDVVYIAGITSDCGPDVQALARIGFKPKLTINPSNCADETGYIAAGAAADGGVVPSYLKNPADPKLASDPGVKTYLSEVKTANKDNTIAVAGWTTADLTINTLLQASKLPGGLTHANVIRAARNQNYASPMLINGITWQSTAKELVGFSGFQTTVWNAKTKTFSADGGVISLAG